MIVPPYEPLRFPLSTEEFEALLTAPPPPLPEILFSGNNANNSTFAHADYRSASGSCSYRTRHRHTRRNHHLTATSESPMGIGKSYRQSQQKRLNNSSRDRDQENPELEQPSVIRNLDQYLNQRRDFNKTYRSLGTFYKRRLKHGSVSNNQKVNEEDDGDGDHELKDEEDDCCVDEEEDDDYEESEDDEYDIEEDDGFQRHHLRLPIDILFRNKSDRNRSNLNINSGVHLNNNASNIGDNVDEYGDDDDDYDYLYDESGAVGGEGGVGSSPLHQQLSRYIENPYVNDEDDSSASEPYQDDDPNDPEWRGESKSERLRKRT